MLYTSRTFCAASFTNTADDRWAPEKLQHLLFVDDAATLFMGSPRPLAVLLRQVKQTEPAAVAYSRLRSWLRAVVAEVRGPPRGF